MGLAFVCNAPFPEYPKHHPLRGCWARPYHCAPQCPRPGELHPCRLDFDLPREAIHWLRDSLLEAAKEQGMLEDATSPCRPPAAAGPFTQRTG